MGETQEVLEALDIDLEGGRLGAIRQVLNALPYTLHIGMRTTKIEPNFDPVAIGRCVCSIRRAEKR